jgi:hypothetical protein
VKEAALVGRPLRSNDERADVGDVLLIGMHMTEPATRQTNEQSNSFNSKVVFFLINAEKVEKRKGAGRCTWWGPWC